MSEETPNPKLAAYHQRLRDEARAEAEADAASYQKQIQRLFREGAEEQARRQAGPGSITINGRTIRVKRSTGF